MSKTSTSVKAKYNAKAYDRIALTVKKGLRDVIRDYAEKQGMTLNGYINSLIKQDMGDALCCESKELAPDPSQDA